ncbi:hypothetical protein KA005_08885, partial [bacterium]|nr:hypothetical protein [bacterium]
MTEEEKKQHRKVREWANAIIDKGVMKGWEYPTYYSTWEDCLLSLRYRKTQDENDLPRREFITPENSERLESIWLRGIKEARASFSDKNEYDRMLCRHNTYYLAKYVLNFDRMTFHFHYGMCKQVDDIKLGVGHRQLWELARDCYKSTIFTITASVKYILNDPNIRILIKSHKDAGAEGKLVAIKNIFNECVALHEIFPEYKPKKSKDRGSNKKYSCVPRKSIKEEHTLQALGVGSSAVGGHFDIIICDDYWDQHSVRSPELSGKVMAEIDELEYLLQSPEEGNIHYIGTRFSFNDPTQKFLENPEYKCTIVSGIIRDPVTQRVRSCFPEQLSLKKFYAQYRSSRYTFSCQIMLNPVATDLGFKDEWYRYASYN